MSSCVVKEAENKNVGSGKVRLLAINDTGIILFALVAIDS